MKIFNIKFLNVKLKIFFVVRDRSICLQVNLVPFDKPADLYSGVAILVRRSIT